MLSRVDTATRSFAALLGVVIGAAIVAGLIGCCVIGVVTYRFGEDGLSAIDKPGTAPALVLLALFGSGAILGAAVFGISLWAVAVAPVIIEVALFVNWHRGFVAGLLLDWLIVCVVASIAACLAGRVV